MISDGNMSVTYEFKFEVSTEHGSTHPHLLLLPSTPLHLCRPERWENPPETIASMPGVWGHLMTFLGGPRACIGYRFSLVEFVLVSLYWHTDLLTRS